MAKKSSGQKSAQKPAQQPASKGVNTKNLLDRGFISLEDAKWDEADGFFEQVLNENAREASAYLGKLMKDLNYRTENDFTTGMVEFADNENYAKIERFGDNAIKEKVQGYNSYAVYNQAKAALDAANSVEGILEAKQIFCRVAGFLDAKPYMDQCSEIIYTYAYETVKEGYANIDNTDGFMALYKAMSDTLKCIADHKNSAEIAQKCDETLTVYEEKLQKINSDFVNTKAELEHQLFAERKREKERINALRQQSTDISLELADKKNKSIFKLFTDSLSAEGQNLKDQLDIINKELEQLTNEGAESKFKKEFVKHDIERQRALKNAYVDILENYNILDMFEVAGAQQQ